MRERVVTHAGSLSGAALTKCHPDRSLARSAGRSRGISLRRVVAQTGPGLAAAP